MQRLQRSPDGVFKLYFEYYCPVYRQDNILSELMATLLRLARESKKAVLLRRPAMSGAPGGAGAKFNQLG